MCGTPSGRWPPGRATAGTWRQWRGTLSTWICWHQVRGLKTLVFSGVTRGYPHSLVCPTCVESQAHVMEPSLCCLAFENMGVRSCQHMLSAKLTYVLEHVLPSLHVYVPLVARFRSFSLRAAATGDDNLLIWWLPILSFRSCTSHTGRSCLFCACLPSSTVRCRPHALNFNVRLWHVLLCHVLLQLVTTAPSSFGCWVSLMPWPRWRVHMRTRSTA